MDDLRRRGVLKAAAVATGKTGTQEGATWCVKKYLGLAGGEVKEKEGADRSRGVKELGSHLGRSHAGV